MDLVETNNYKITADSIAHKNKLLSNLLDKMAFKDGEIFTNSSVIAVGGYLTTGRTQVIFNVPVDKFIPKDMNIEVLDIIASVRGGTGGYVIEYSHLSDSGTLTAVRSSGSSVNVTLTLKKASTAANNMALGVQLTTVELKFTKK